MILSKKQRGVGLIEVMVSVVILSVALLSIASLQTRSLQYNQSAYWRSQANIFAYDIMDRMRLNRSKLSEYTMAFGATTSGSGIAATDTAEWIASIKGLLPAGEGEISCTAANLAANVPTTCSVSVRWTESNIFGDIAEGELDAEARTTFTYVTAFQEE